MESFVVRAVLASIAFFHSRIKNKKWPFLSMCANRILRQNTADFGKHDSGGG
jgi:hypothetical protein